MKIIVAGCGKIGDTIISSLVNEGHDVLAIDTDQAVLNEITNVCDIMTVCGNAADCVTLNEAGVSAASLFVAVTGSDELNMLACYFAKRMGALHTICRIRNPEYNTDSLTFMRQNLDLSMAINPEMTAAKELYNILKFPTAVNIETFSRRDFEMIEIKLKPDSPLDGMSLYQMRSKYKAKVLVCAVQREDEVFIPDGNFVLKGGDRIGITATSAEFERFFRELNVYQKQAKNVMILGGSRTAFYLSKMLTNFGSNVTVIDKDPEVCKLFTDELDKVNVVNGDGALQELLIEEGIKDVDAFVSLTGMDEVNILISEFASYMKVPKVIPKINRTELMNMVERFGLDTVVSPKKIISDVLVRYARALDNSLGSNVETLYNLMDGKVEALEFRVSHDFKMAGIPLREMKLKKNILVAGIIRERKPLIPSGDDVIMHGDRVIVFCAGQRLQDLTDTIR